MDQNTLLVCASGGCLSAGDAMWQCGTESGTLKRLTGNGRAGNGRGRASRVGRPAHRSLRFETLECRQLLTHVADLWAASGDGEGEADPMVAFRLETSDLSGVPISEVLRTRMYAADYGDLDYAREEYAKLERNAGACADCTRPSCAGRCPLGLDIAALSTSAHSALARG